MTHRVLCYGSLGPDLLHRVPRLPRRGEDLPATEAALSYGGGAANPAVALAAWEVRAAVLGHQLGTDPLAAWLVDELERHGVDTALVQRAEGTATPHCLVLLTPDGERTIVSSGYQGAVWEEPTEDLWDDPDLVTVDRYSGEAGARVARSARARGIPVVGIDTAEGDWVVRSRSEHPDEAEARHLAAEGRTVILTDGPRSATLFTPEEVLVAEPPPVEATDPTGAGDVLAAACALGVLEGWTPGEILRRAVATGALLAARGRSAGTPARAEIEAAAAGIRVRHRRER